MSDYVNQLVEVLSADLLEEEIEEKSFLGRELDALLDIHTRSSQLYLSHQIFYFTCYCWIKLLLMKLPSCVPDISWAWSDCLELMLFLAVDFVDAIFVLIVSFRASLNVLY